MRILISSIFLLTALLSFGANASTKRFDQIRDLIMSAEGDLSKFYDKGNQAAGTRVRKTMQDLKALAQEIDKEAAQLGADNPSGSNQGPDLGYFNPFYLLRDLILSSEADFYHFYAKGNKAAGTRVRKTMQELKGLAHDISIEVLKMQHESEGAEVEIVYGDLVTYLRITLPSGKVIVKEVGKKN